MSKITPVSAAIELELRRRIVAEVRRCSLPLSDELMGYTLYAKDLQRRYGLPGASSVPRPRQIAAPEFLTGLVKNQKI